MTAAISTRGRIANDCGRRAFPATLVFVTALTVAALQPAQAQTQPDDPAATGSADGEQVRLLALPKSRVWRDDFDHMQKRRLVRILVPPSRTLFFQDKGAVRGVAAEAAFEFEKWLNKRYPAKPYKFYVMLTPTPRDKLLQYLREGRGDIVAANMTVTPEREKLVDFARPWLKGVKEVLVTGPKAPQVATLDDLAEQEARQADQDLDHRRESRRRRPDGNGRRRSVAMGGGGHPQGEALGGDPAQCHGARGPRHP
jgi:hypothetical protein